MKYKVGDRVKYDSEICTVTKVLENQGKFKYRVQSDTWFDVVEDEMIEGLVEELLDNDMEEHQKIVDEIMAIQGIEPIEAEIEEVWHCPEGYIFKDENGNVINATKIVLEKKKKEYPKTYEECLSVLQIRGYDIVTYVPSWTAYEKTLCQQVLKLRELIICRDAYWKIAGEEMGLGEPWEPDLLDDSQLKFALANWKNTIENSDYSINKNYILIFPTEEMRDAFYENFKSEIEICKELL